MRRKVLVALILTILVASILLYVFFAVPLVKGYRQEALRSSWGLVWYIEYTDDGILYPTILFPGQTMELVIHQRLVNVSIPFWAPVKDASGIEHPSKMPGPQDKEILEKLLKDLGIEPEKIELVVYEESVSRYYEYECSLSYQYFGIGYYRERLLYQFFQ